MPIAQDDVAYVAHAQAVDQNVTFGHLTRRSSPVRAELEHLAALDDKDVFLGNAYFLGEAGMMHQLTILAMDWHKEARAGEVEHHFVLLPAGVTRDVHPGPLVVIDLGAGAVEVVDGPVDQLFVPGDGCRRDDDVIAGADVHLAMLPDRHPHQRRRGLTLAAGARDSHLVRRQAVHLLRAQQLVGRQVQVPQLGRALDVLQHRASHDAQLPAVPESSLVHLLHPRDVRGEGGHDDPPVGAGKDLVERLGHNPLRRRLPICLGVGRIGQQHVDAPAAQLGQAGKIGQTAVDRCLVEFEVARVDDKPHRGGNAQAYAVGDGVTNTKELDPEGGQVQHIVGRDGAQVRIGQ